MELCITEQPPSGVEENKHMTYVAGVGSVYRLGGGVRWSYNVHSKARTRGGQQTASVVNVKAGKAIGYTPHKKFGRKLTAVMPIANAAIPQATDFV